MRLLVVHELFTLRMKLTLGVILCFCKTDVNFLFTQYVKLCKQNTLHIYR